MVIIKNRSDEKDVKMSSSTKVGRANSRDVRLRKKDQPAPFKTEEGTGTITTLNQEGKMVAPKAKEKKEKKKSLFAMAKEAKKQKR